MERVNPAVESEDEAWFGMITIGDQSWVLFGTQWMQTAASADDRDFPNGLDEVATMGEGLKLSSGEPVEIVAPEISGLLPMMEGTLKDDNYMVSPTMTSYSIESTTMLDHTKDSQSLLLMVNPSDTEGQVNVMLMDTTIQ